MFGVKVHRSIYLLGLIILGVAMPFSALFTSMAQFLLAFNFILELDFKQKRKRILANKPALFIIAIFLIHVLSLLNSDNYTYAFHDLKIKLPLLILPFIVGSSPSLKAKEINRILSCFIASVFASSLYILYYYFAHQPILNIREISVFISHIRLGLMVNLSLFVLLYWAYKTRSIKQGILAIGLIIYFIYFLYILKSGTGFTLLLVISTVFYIRYLISLWTQKKRIVFHLTFILIGLFLFTYKAYQFKVNHFTLDPPPSQQILKDKSKKGAAYTHDLESGLIANGHYVYLNLAKGECQLAWEARSEIPFYESLPEIDIPVCYILYQYLSSLNLPKDAEGVSTLTEHDIQLIESGCVNPLLENKSDLYVYVYRLINQLIVYYHTGEANGGTLTQRLEYLRVGFEIFKDNPFLGVGIGDIDDMYRLYYKKGLSSLNPDFQHRAHNQLFTFLLIFGLLGFMLVLYFFLAPYFYLRSHVYIWLFGIIFFVSMLNEDTLETATGIVFFTFFYSLFLLPKTDLKP